MASSVIAYHLLAATRFFVSPLMPPAGGSQEVPEPWDKVGTPLDFVVSRNLRRRHLNESQRSMVADKIATMKRGGDRGNQHTGGKMQICSLPDGVSRAQAAEMLNIGERSVGKAHVVRKQGVERKRKPKRPRG